jgi:AcrR family transcriptional regulator
MATAMKATPVAPASGRLPRGSLDRQAIVDAAMAVVAKCGADGLTVPEVARRLGVGRTAVSWHFPRRGDLLRAASESAIWQFNELFPEPTAILWQEQVREYWTRYRAILRGSKVLLELLAVRWAFSARSPEVRRQHYRRIDGQLRVLMEAGLSPEQAARGYHTLSTYTRGCLLNERSAEQELDGEQLPAIRELAHLPSLERAAPYWNVSFATNDDFDAGLDMIIDGLSPAVAGCQLRGTPSRSKPS